MPIIIEREMVALQPPSRNVIVVAIPTRPAQSNLRLFILTRTNMTIDYPITARSFRCPEAIRNRESMLQQPHIEKLTDYVKGLHKQHSLAGWEFPYFDPYDGGQEADILFLLEKPGPMTSKNGKRKGSGFISRDNNDFTAEAVFTFMKDANIPRERTILWNTIPGWNKTIKIAAAERKEGQRELLNLLELLPKLKTVVLVGTEAQRLEDFIRSKKLHVVTSAHPSGQVKRFNPEMWKGIPEKWKMVFAG